MQVSASPALVATQASRISGASAPMTAAQAVNAFKTNPNTKVEISDTALNIQNNFDALSKMGTKLSKMSVTDPATRISLTASQFAAGAKALSSIKTSYELKLTNVTMDKLNTLSANSKVKQLEVADTSANISAKFQSLLNQPNKIGTITQLGAPSAITLSADLYSRNTSTAVLAKIDGGSYTLSLSDMKIGANGIGAGTDLATALANSRVTSVGVRDTSANLATQLAGGASALSNAKVSSIVQTDANNSIAVTDTQLQNQVIAGTLAKLAGTSSLSVTGVTAARAATVAGNTNVKSVSVTDTAANVYANRGTISGLNSGVNKVTAINIEDTGSNLSANFANIAGMNGISKIKLSNTANITITGAQLKDNAAMLAKVHGSNNVKGNYHLTVTSVAAADILATAKLATVDKINVNDTVSQALANLTALKSSKVDKIDLSGAGALIGGSNLDKLDGLGAKLVSVTNSNSADIGITFDQYVKRSATLAKIDTGSLVVSEAGASVAKQLLDDVKVSGFSVKDSAANLTRNYGDLNDALTDGKLTQMRLSENADIKLTADQYTEASAAGGLLSVVQDAAGTDDFTLQISGALATNIVALSGTANFDKVTKVSISDSSSNIAAKLTELGDAYADSKLGAIYITGTPSDIGISKSDLDDVNIAGALSKISNLDGTPGSYTLDVSGVGAADASDLLSINSKVAKLSVEDTSANISENLASIAAISASKLKAVTVSDFGTEDITVAASNLAAYATVLGKVTDGDYSLNVTDVTASQAKLLTENNTKVAHLTVLDTGTSVSAKLGDLNGLTDSGKLTAITLDDPANTIILTSTQYDDNGASALSILNSGDYKLAISGVSVADAIDDTKNVNADSTHVASYSVKDVGANIQTNLEALDDRGGKLQSINWTDSTDSNGDPTALSITGQEYVDFIGTLSKINGGEYNAHITDLSANDTLAAESDANISEFSVKDSAENLGKNLAALQTSASAGTVKIQAIEQSDVGDVAMTATEYADSGDARAMMTGLTMTVSDVAAADVGTLITGDTQVVGITVDDTAANIAAMLGDSGTAGDLDTHAALISSITISDDAVLNLTGAQYADNVAAGGILDKLASNTGGYHAVVTDLAAGNVAAATSDTNVDSFEVADDAAGLTANFSDMVDAGDKLTAITQSDTDPVSIALSDLVANPVDYAQTLEKFATPPALTLT